jgi:hypothetical protein
LDETGATVTSASPAEATAQLPNAPVDLLVLCHTVSDHMVDVLMEMLGLHHPGAWALVLGKRHRSLAETEARIVVLMDVAEPNLLVETAQLLLPRLIQNAKADRMTRLIERFREGRERGGGGRH